MKRIVALALVLVLVAAAFASCGGSANAEGKYVVKSVNGQTLEEAIKAQMGELGDSVDLDAYLKMMGIESLDDYMTLELKADGTASMNLAMQDIEAGTWKQDGNNVTITVDDEPQVFTLDGNELKASLEGQEYIFVKK